MSWDLYLVDAKSQETLQLPEKHHITGGTYAVGGIRDAWLNVTYNYGVHFNFGGLDGMTGAESVPTMEPAAARLDTDVDPDYWKPTEGNVRRALENCIALATACPQGVWRVR